MTKKELIGKCKKDLVNLEGFIDTANKRFDNFSAQYLAGQRDKLKEILTDLKNLEGE